jgi:hypothetical protein
LIQIQSGRQQPTSDLKVEPRACHDPLDVPCIYHKGVRGTRSVAVGCRGRSIGSATSRALRKLPRLRTVVSSRRHGSASPPTTRDLPGGVSWWSQRTTHRESAQRIPRKHVGPRPRQTAPSDRRRSSARRYPVCPRPASRVRRGGSADVQQPSGPTWAQRWHIFSRPIPHPRSKQPWCTSGSPLLWWRRRA